MKKDEKRSLVRTMAIQIANDSLAHVDQGFVVFGKNSAYPFGKLYKLTDGARRLAAGLKVNKALLQALNLILGSIGNKKFEQEVDVQKNILRVLKLCSLLSEAWYPRKEWDQEEAGLQNYHAQRGQVANKMYYLRKEIDDTLRFFEFHRLEKAYELGKKLSSIRNQTLQLGHLLIQSSTSEARLSLMLGEIILALLEIVPFFTVEKKLGESRQSKVFQITFSKDVFALKVFSPDHKVFSKRDMILAEVKKSFREQRIIEKLNHNNIISIYHFFENIDIVPPEKKKGEESIANSHLILPAYTMEICPETLASYIAKKIEPAPRETIFQNPTLTKEALKYLVQVAQGLEFIHSKGATHNNIKPSNILLKNNKAMIADFGITFSSKFAQEQWQKQKKHKSSPNKIRELEEILQDMPPEIRGKKSNYTVACDIYSFGQTILRLLFSPQARPEPEVLKELQGQPAPEAPFPMPHIRGYLLNLITKLCNPHPGKRPDVTQTKMILKQIFVAVDKPEQAIHLQYQIDNMKPARKVKLNPQKLNWIALTAAGVLLCVSLVYFALQFFSSATSSRITENQIESPREVAQQNPETNSSPVEENTKTTMSVEDLIHDLKNGNQRVAQEAIEELVEKKVKAIPYLVRALPTFDDKAKEYAAEVFERVGEGSYEFLTQAMEKGNQDLQLSAIQVCSHIRIKKDYFIDPLQRILATGEDEAKIAAINTIGEIAQADSLLVNDLLFYYRESDPRIRRAAAIALTRIAPVEDEAAGAFIFALREENPDLRFQASAALEKISIGPEAFPELVASLAHAELLATELFLKIGEPAIPTLIAALDNPAPETRYHVVSVLGKMPGSKQEIAQGLAPYLLKDESTLVRQNIASVLGELAPASEVALPQLIRALKDSDEEVVYNSVLAIGEFGSRAAKAIRPLARLLKNRHQHIRLAVIATFLKIGIKALPALAYAMRSPDPKVRYSAANAMAQLGPAAKKAIPILKKALRDPNRSVRKAARNALVKMQKR